MMLLSALVLLAASSLAAPAPAPVAGEVCVFAGTRQLECRTTSARRFELPRKDGSSFVWHDRAWTELALGSLTTSQSVVDLDARDWRGHAVALRVLGDEPPESATLTFANVDATLTPKAIASLRRLWLPRLSLPGTAGTLLLSAPHFRDASRNVKNDTEGLGTLALQPLPSLRGIVVNADDNQPRGDATIVSPSNETLARAGIDGRFRAWIENDWPPFVRVSAPGRATLQLAIPKVVADADLGTIALNAGGALHVTLDETAPLDLRVLRRNGRTWDEVAARTHVSGATELAQLEAGSYAVVVRGDGPLQRLALETNVREGETTELPVKIEPAELNVFVRGQEPGKPVTIALGPSNQTWQTSIATDNDGRATTELWQRGEYVGWITADGTMLPRVATLDGAQRIEWTIDLPHATLEGHVVDDANQPVSGAEVQLDTHAEGAASTQRVETTDAAGHFAFERVATGTQTLTATAEGHLPATTSLLFGSGEQRESVTLRMRNGVARTLQIVDANGAPAADATVVDESGFENERHTDANGFVTFTLSAGEQKTLYVLPRSGSFAIVDVSGDAKNASTPLRVVVPAGVAAIRVAAQTTGGAPMTNVAFALRVGGRMLSPMIRSVMSNRAGIPIRTGDDGSALLVAVPAGVYELWPYFTGDQLRAILAGTTPPEARIVAQPGLNQVAFRFERP
ncbi:MAG: carboxypeptidase regulatory-like domain-containing protein [Acidobacteria bacterium]|nr:carboxypeptidase regulatory-like domain-containing protein [Acidobacteriota bacterium]MBV9476384.1 carboxypeptidase regulatory-like domain-containing protein [Acidobacteriota bacterium]